MHNKILILALLFILISPSIPFIPIVESEQIRISSLVIEAPDSVTEETSFQITIIDNSALGQGIPGVAVRISWDDTIHVTGISGTTVVQAPSVDQTTEFTINASCPGYEPATKPITVVDSSSYLIIEAPNSLYEGENFDVIIQGQTPFHTEFIDNAEVIFNSTLYHTVNGRVQIHAPYVQNDQVFQLTASKEGFLSAKKNILVKNREMHQLEIEAPDLVTAGTPFIVSVTSKGLPVETVSVYFQNHLFFTNSSGQVIITAPLVEGDTRYEITAQKTGYLDASVFITVLPQEERNEYGRIHGVISSSTGYPLENVSVCAIRLDDDAKTCDVTDIHGSYFLSIPSGQYTIQARKKFYTTSIVENVTVQANTSVEINITLEKEFTDQNQTLIEDAIHTGSIGAEISVQQEGALTQISKIIHVNMSINSSINTMNHAVSLRLDSTEKSGKVIMVTVDPSLFSLGNIIVQFDGRNITKTDTLSNVLTLGNDGSQVQYYVHGETMFIRIPEFSTHTITIIPVQKIVEVLGGPVAILFYIIVCVLGASAFIYPFAAWPSQIRKGKKR